MKIYNNTQNELYYDINATDADCGAVAAQQTADIPAVNQETDVTVNVGAVSPDPGTVQAFTVTIPESQTHTVVTIGLYKQ